MKGKTTPGTILKRKVTSRRKGPFTFLCRSTLSVGRLGRPELARRTGGEEEGEGAFSGGRGAKGREVVQRRIGGTALPLFTLELRGPRSRSTSTEIGGGLTPKRGRLGAPRTGQFNRPGCECRASIRLLYRLSRETTKKGPGGSGEARLRERKGKPHRVRQEGLGSSSGKIRPNVR